MLRLLRRLLGEFFHDKGALWAIPVPLWLGAAVTFLTVDRFGPTYACVIISGLWSLACWFGSDFLKEKRKQLRRSDHVGFMPRPPESKTRFALWLWIIPALIVVATVGLCLYVRSDQTKKELTENNGSLIPASEPTPDNACSHNPTLKKDDYLVLLGKEAAFFRTFPHTVIAVHRTVPLLWFTLDKDGGIEVNADIHSPDMKLVAKLRQNHFDINPNEIFKKERPDFSTLSITDAYGNSVLNVRFINPHTLSVTGVLFYPGVAPIVIPSPGFNEVCSGSTNVDINIH
jgi:hypothetical protein